MYVEVKFGEHSWESLVRSPFSDEAGGVPVGIPGKEWKEATLAWYFEKYYQFPMEPIRKERAEAVLKEYGRRLFSMVVPPEKLQLYESWEVKEMVIQGPPGFHALHWETLRDGKDPLPVRIPLTRLPTKPTEDALGEVRTTDLRVLVVTPRPSGPEDIKLRTISLPLVTFAKEHPDLHIHVHVLRPATFESLSKHLDAVGPGHYHVLHFDGHGDVLTKQQVDKLMMGRPIFQQLKGNMKGGNVKGYDQEVDLVHETFEGAHPCLLFESGDGQNYPNPVDGFDVRKVVTRAQIPVVVLDACRTGSECGEESLAAMLMEGEAAAVIGNGFSILVDASKLFVVNLYRLLFADGLPIDRAVQRARSEMRKTPLRQMRLSETVSLEDWSLPRLFLQKSDVKLKLVAQESSPDYQEKWSQAAQVPVTKSRLEYGFVGREREVQEIEERVLREQKGANILLLHGMGGAGKSTLMEHLGKWWQTSDFIEGVFEFAYDHKAYTVEMILAEIGRKILGEMGCKTLSLKDYKAQMEVLCPQLRRRRFLIVLDNLESVTNKVTDYDHMLEVEDQKKIREFLVNLQMEDGTRILGKDAATPSIVFLGSRSEEDWLMKGTQFEKNILDLEGLDMEAQEELALLVLGEENEHFLKPVEGDVEKVKGERFALMRLLKLLGGFPLTIKAVLSTLGAERPPSVVLKELESGVDFGKFKTGEERNHSLMRCLEYSFGVFEDDEQMLLQCLFPFHGVLMKDEAWRNFVMELKKKESLNSLPHDKWEALLGEACRRGLLMDDPTASKLYYKIHPVFPFFLRTKAENGGEIGLKEQQQCDVRSAFAKNKVHCAIALWNDYFNLKPKETRKFLLGCVIVKYEEENFVSACKNLIARRESFRVSLNVLDEYWRFTRLFSVGLHYLMQMRSHCLEPESLESEYGFAYIDLCDFICYYLFELHLHKRSIEAINELTSKLIALNDNNSRLVLRRLHFLRAQIFFTKRNYLESAKEMKSVLDIEKVLGLKEASTYLFLGKLAFEENKFQDAEVHFLDAIPIIQDSNTKADALFYLGRLYEREKKWSLSKKKLNEALGLYSSAGTQHKIAKIKHTLGWIEHQEGSFLEAEKLYREALEILIDDVERLKVFHHLGILFQEQRHLSEAKFFFLESLKLSRKLGDVQSIGSSLYHIGLILEAEKDFDGAMDQYNQSKDLIRGQADSKSRTDIIRKVEEGLARVLAFRENSQHHADFWGKLEDAENC